MAKNATLKTASVLAFERKLDPSDALFFAGRWADIEKASDWKPVAIREKSVRGTISNRLKATQQDPAKLDAAIENPNLQTVDISSLPGDADTLQARFTLRVLSGAGTPSACNSADYQKKLLGVVQAYIEEHGFQKLASRYAQNLANGRFLWRNRIGAEQVQVRISRLVEGVAEKTWRFNALDVPLRSFDARGSDLKELADLLAQGLSGAQHVLLDVRAFARVGNGQEVFPSQELILDRGRGDKSKTLYDVNGVAAMHSQKIGNAIRTIDTWYPQDEDQLDMGPIAVEPYGSVTTQGKAYRQPRRKMDFYSLLDNWLIKDETPAEEQQHFVMAVLIRGGVFGDAG
jgi:CRISPR-associated protein Csy3